MFVSDVCMLTCFLCVHLLICIYISEIAQGLDWRYSSRKHMFSADRAGERGD